MMKLLKQLIFLNIKYFQSLNSIRITQRIENYLNISNVNMTKIECLNNIAICHYLKKDYENCIDKLNDVSIDSQLY